MLTIKEKGLILKIIAHSNRVLEKIKDIDYENFSTNEDIKEIVCFNIFQIGELSKRFKEDFLTKYNKMPWKDIKGMRDWIAHGYGTINSNEVWNTATKEIPALLAYCEEILNSNL